MYFIPRPTRHQKKDLPLSLPKLWPVPPHHHLFSCSKYSEMQHLGWGTLIRSRKIHSLYVRWRSNWSSTHLMPPFSTFQNKTLLFPPWPTGRDASRMTTLHHSPAHPAVLADDTQPGWLYSPSWVSWSNLHLLSSPVSSSFLPWDSVNTIPTPWGISYWQKKQLTWIFLQAGNSHN